MTLRTPNPYRSYMSMLDMQRSKERMAILQDQITKDKRITRLSDDPTGAALIMDFQTSIERNKMYVKQGEAASSFLTGTETSLSTINTQMDRLLELAEQGRSDITAERGRAAIAAEIEGIINTIMDVANTKEQGKFIFAGTNTTTKPFDFSSVSAAGDWYDAWILSQGPPPTPPVWPDAVDYNGNRFNIDIDISATATITSNLSGELVFQGSRDAGGNLDPDQDLFIAMCQLRDGLANNDRDLIELGYNNIRQIKERINVCLTTVGSRQNQMENSKNNLEDFNEALQSIQNTYDGVDYPWAISQFNAEQTSQQAGLAILGRMGRYSLFDYIG